MCEKPGVVLDDNNEELFRQVKRRHIDKSTQKLSREAFQLLPTDECCLSVSRGSMLSAEESFALHTSPKPQGFEMKSIVGVWAVMVGDVKNLNVLPWSDEIKADVDQNKPANPAHAIIDLENQDADRLEWIAIELHRCAVKKHP